MFISTNRLCRAVFYWGWDQVKDDAGNLYKFKASVERLESVCQAVADRLKMPREAILLKYVDDDGDHIVLTG